MEDDAPQTTAASFEMANGVVEFVSAYGSAEQVLLDRLMAVLQLAHDAEYKATLILEKSKHEAKAKWMHEQAKEILAGIRVLEANRVGGVHPAKGG